MKKKQARRLNRIKITNKQKVNPDGISIFVFLSCCCCCCCISFVDKNLYKLIKQNLSNNNSSNKLICECESKHFAETEMQKKNQKTFQKFISFPLSSIHSFFYQLLHFVIFFSFSNQKKTHNSRISSKKHCSLKQRHTYTHTHRNENEKFFILSLNISVVYTSDD